METSYYNFLIKNDKLNNYLLYNSMSNCLMEIDAELYNLISSKNFDDLSQNTETIKKLEDSGFLCKSQYLQKESVAKQVKKKIENRFNSTKKKLALTLYPTLSCNLKCQYCYQDNLSGKTTWNSEYKRKIYEFIKRKITYGEITELNISWMGGEPLLFANELCLFQKKINNLCHQHDCIVKSKIITNGILLDRKNSNKLVESNIKEAQITIDGTKKIHNERRYWPRNPERNFETVLSNIKNANSKLDISIRINLDKRNLPCLEELTDIIAKEIWPFKKTVIPYLGHLRDEKDPTFINEFTKSQFFNLKEDYRYILYHKYKNINNNVKLKYMFPYEDKLVNCGATRSLNFWVVAPDERLYKCWHLIGNQKFCLGSIDDLLSDSLMIKNKIENEWTLNLNDMKSWGCLNCKHLPICDMLCPHNYLNPITGKGQMEQCSDWKYLLERRLIEQYNLYIEKPDLFKKETLPFD